MIRPIDYLSKPVLGISFSDYTKMSEFLFKNDRIYANSMRKKGFNGSMEKFLKSQPEVRDAFDAQTGKLSEKGQNVIKTELKGLGLPVYARVYQYLDATLTRLREMAFPKPQVINVNGKRILQLSV